MHILIIEDEDALATGLKFNFEQEGYRVTHFAEGPPALAEFRADRCAFDLVVLDLMLPGMSGYEICEEIRRINKDVPVIVLSARTLSEDKTRAFDAGTDQYMTKPFALPELLSRVRNLLERRRSEDGGDADARTDAKPFEPTEYRFNSVIVDFRQFELRVGRRKHSLTTMEMQLLRFFIEHENQVLSRDQILDGVWGLDAAVTNRTIDNFVMRLRKLIEPDPSQPRHILSIRGTGYRFVPGE